MKFYARAKQKFLETHSSIKQLRAIVEFANSSADAGIRRPGIAKSLIPYFNKRIRFAAETAIIEGAIFNHGSILAFIHGNNYGFSQNSQDRIARKLGHSASIGPDEKSLLARDYLACFHSNKAVIILADKITEQDAPSALKAMSLYFGTPSKSVKDVDVATGILRLSAMVRLAARIPGEKLGLVLDELEIWNKISKDAFLKLLRRKSSASPEPESFSEHGLHYIRGSKNSEPGGAPSLQYVEGGKALSSDRAANLHYVRG